MKSIKIISAILFVIACLSAKSYAGADWLKDPFALGQCVVSPFTTDGTVQCTGVFSNIRTQTADADSYAYFYTGASLSRTNTSVPILFFTAKFKGKVWTCNGVLTNSTATLISAATSSPYFQVNISPSGDCSYVAFISGSPFLTVK